MGVTNSREFSNEVATYVNQGGDLENLLKDPDFVGRWKPSCQTLLLQKRLNNDLTQQNRQAKRRKAYLSKLQQVQESDICISKSLEPIYKSWMQPTTFFNPSERLKGASPAAHLYEELRHIGQRKVDDPIRTRIFAVALYDLRLQIDENNYLQLKRGIKEKIVQVISESSVVCDSTKDIGKWTKLYLKFGERMKAIAVGNGGLGALIMMPSLSLSLYHWTRGLSADELKNYILHLQSLGLAEKARNANAHEVARRIHALALQGLTSGIEEPNVHHEEAMPDEEADKDSISEDLVEDDGLSKISRAASSCTSLSTLAQGRRRSQEHIYRVGIEDDERGRPNPLTLAFDGGRSNEKRQRNEGYNPGPTIQPFQSTPQEPFPTTAIGAGQLHGFGTELNYTATNTAPNVFNEAWSLSQSPNPRLYNEAWSLSQSPNPGPYNEAWSLSQPPNPGPYNEAWSLSQPPDPDPYNDAWPLLSQPSEPDPRSF